MWDTFRFIVDRVDSMVAWAIEQPLKHQYYPRHYNHRRRTTRAHTNTHTHTHTHTQIFADGTCSHRRDRDFKNESGGDSREWTTSKGVYLGVGFGVGLFVVVT